MFVATTNKTSFCHSWFGASIRQPVTLSTSLILDANTDKLQDKYNLRLIGTMPLQASLVGEMPLQKHKLEIRHSDFVIPLPMPFGPISVLTQLLYSSTCTYTFLQTRKKRSHAYETYHLRGNPSTAAAAGAPSRDAAAVGASAGGAPSRRSGGRSPARLNLPPATVNKP
jgi:hypothetical protein